MSPHLAQVLNTLAHEIRTPLAVSQGYLKLYLDGRFANEEDTRRAMEQTRQALGTLAALCVDMGKVSAIADGVSRGVPERVSVSDFVKRLREQGEMEGAEWTDDAVTGAIDTTNSLELAQAVAIVAKAAFDDDRTAARAVRLRTDQELVLLAGAATSLAQLPLDPGAPNARPLDFARGGKGLKLIWAAFVLEKHRVQAWAAEGRRASVGIRIPLVQA